MANSFSNLVLDALTALDVVSREMVGFIPAVSRSATADRAAVGQTIRIPVAPASTAATISAGQLPPDTGDQTITNKTITMDNFRSVPIRWTGEEIMSINTGYNWRTLFGDQLMQAFRTLTNEMETDIGDLAASASNAASPAGTTLFDAANYKDLAAMRRLLNVNGAPETDRHLVLSSGSAAAFLGNAQNTAADTTGTANFYQQGVLGTRFNFNLRESAQVNSFTAGTASSATTDNAGYAIGDTVLTLASAGTGTILAGDVISITGDASGEKYVVASGDSDVSNGGTITLAAPGLKGTLSAATHAITVDSSATRNMAFTRNAIALATRLPAAPPTGDSAKNVAVITDPRSGISFELREYGEYRRVHYELAVCWGVAMIKPEHCVLLID